MYRFFLSFFICLFLTNSCSPKVDEQEKSGPLIHGEENMSNIMKTETSRLNDLLDVDRTGVDLIENPIFVDPETIGALGGYSYRTSTGSVTVNIYIFELLEQLSGAVPELESLAPPDTMGLQYAFNGRLLLFGYYQRDSENDLDSRFLLSRIITAFSGDE